MSHAGLAALTLIEEHGKQRLTETDLHGIYGRVDEWLKGTQDAEEIARLRACARIVIQRLSIFISKPSDENFSLHDALEAYEAKLIAEVLEAEGDSVTSAAKRLGVSHQLLIRTLNMRHRELLHKRTPSAQLKRSIMKKPKG